LRLIGVDNNFTGIEKLKFSFTDDPSKKFIDVAGDGNCFYRCLAMWLRGNEELYAAVKAEIFSYLENEIKDDTKARKWIGSILGKPSTTKNLHNWISMMKKPGVYASIDVLQVSAELYNINIYSEWLDAKTLLPTAPFVTVMPPPRLTNESKDIWLRFLNNPMSPNANHYQISTQDLRKEHKNLKNKIRIGPASIVDEPQLAVFNSNTEIPTKGTLSC
jgi:hypothetical protein